MFKLKPYHAVLNLNVMVFFEHDLLKQHFKEKTDIEKYLVSNGTFLKKKKK